MPAKKGLVLNKDNDKDVDEITRLFEEMLAVKDQEITDLKQALENALRKQEHADIDPIARKKSSEEVQELGRIRTKIEKLKKLNQTQYDNLVKFTDPSQATINPRGDTIAERRGKIVEAVQIAFDKVMPEKKKKFENDNKNFEEILVIISQLVKEPKPTKEAKAAKKNAEEFFREKFAIL